MAVSFFGNPPSRAWVNLNDLRPVGDMAVKTWIADYVRDRPGMRAKYDRALAVAREWRRPLAPGLPPPPTADDEAKGFTFESEADVGPAEPPIRKRRRRHLATADEAVDPTSIDAGALGICRYCLVTGSNIQCGGPCGRTFHYDCLGIVAHPGAKFTCDRCSAGLSVCHLCHGVSAYAPARYGGAAGRPGTAH